MIQEFSFTWSGRHWNGYFNALANQTVIAHIEDEHLRDAIGQSLSYSKADDGTLTYRIDVTVHVSHPGIYDAIQQGVEVQLGETLNHYLN